MIFINPSNSGPLSAPGEYRVSKGPMKNFSYLHPTKVGPLKKPGQHVYPAETQIMATLNLINNGWAPLNVDPLSRKLW